MSAKKRSDNKFKRLVFTSLNTPFQIWRRSSQALMMHWLSNRAQMLARSSYFFIVTSVYLTIVPRTRCLFAAKSAKLLGSGILQRKEAATKEADKRKSCLIVSFGDYYSGKWCPGLTLFYRYVALINVVHKVNLSIK